MMLKLLLVLTGASFLVGCDILVPPVTNPVIQIGPEDNIRAIATTAERRLVLLGPEQGNASQQFCAEPSPDSVDSLVNMLKANASAGDNATTKADAGLKTTTVTTADKMFARSHGIQLYRDGVFLFREVNRLTHFAGVNADKAEALHAIG